MVAVSSKCISFSILQCAPSTPWFGILFNTVDVVTVGSRGPVGRAEDQRSRGLSSIPDTGHE